MSTYGITSGLSDVSARATVETLAFADFTDVRMAVGKRAFECSRCGSAFSRCQACANTTVNQGTNE
jgi:hypothetical protein